MAHSNASVLDRTVVSGISDTRATSSANHVRDPLIQTLTQSEKQLHGPIRGKTCASNIAKLEHNLREPAKLVDMVPGLASDTLFSGRKFLNADYISIYDKREVNLYDAKTTRIIITENAVLKG